MNYREQYAALQSQLRDLQETLGIVVREELVNEFTPVFAGNTVLQEISWSQYTPTFNDGDACTFHSYHDYSELDFGESDYDQSVESVVYGILENFTSDEMFAAFGDNISVKILRDEAGHAVLSTEEYCDY